MIAKLSCLRLWTVHWVALSITLTGFGVCVCEPNERTIPCKYSVRDVAFVNVHGKAWQLWLVKPVDVEPSQFDQWNRALRSKLERSNVGFSWVKAGSAEAAKIRAIDDPDSRSPSMALVGPGQQWLKIDGENDMPLRDQLEAIMDSPARSKILDQVVESLCVFVVVESGDLAADAMVSSTVKSAVERVKNQMWTLAKPTKHGAQVVVIPKLNRGREQWFLNSIGIDHGESTPAVAIIYGQGRRLGEVLRGKAISLEKLLGRAAVCGQDCECDLDRDWLYRIQMIHSWSKEREREAENSLSFDPHSAMVAAEVAQILQKNLNRSDGVAAKHPGVDLGGGLIFHDLDPVAIPNTNPSTDKTALANSEPRSTLGASKNVNERPEYESSGDREEMGVTDQVVVPWKTILGMAIVAFVVLIVRLSKNR